MSAAEHLQPQQFPVEELKTYYSPEFDSSVAGVHEQFHAYYRRGDTDAREQREKQQALVADVRTHGVKTPIHVADPAPDDEPGRMLLHGHHRVSAAISSGRESVPGYLHKPVQRNGAWDYPTFYDNPKFTRELGGR